MFVLCIVMFPMDILEKGLAASNFGMLGLGDIVVPGTNDAWVTVDCVHVPCWMTVCIYMYLLQDCSLLFSVALTSSKYATLKSNLK